MKNLLKMFSYLFSFFKYFIYDYAKENDDDDKENFLAEQLLELELHANCNIQDVQEINGYAIPRNGQCAQRTGVVSFVGENYILIDGMYYFDTTTSSLHINQNDKVLYLSYRDANESIQVVRILENYGPYWCDEEEEFEESKFMVVEHIIPSEVNYRSDRVVYMKESDLKFNLDEVKGEFIPIKGDWLEMKCSVQWDDGNPSAISTTRVLQVKSFKALRTKITSAIVTAWTGDCGTCDHQFYFNKQSLQDGIVPSVGSKVMLEAVESNQGSLTWRVLKLMVTKEGITENNSISTDLYESEVDLKFEQEKEIEVTYPLKFEPINYNETNKISLNVKNKSDSTYILNKWIILSKKRDSQINITPILTYPKKLYPNQNFQFTITCKPKFLGKTRECLIIMFQDFQVKRFINIDVVDNMLINMDGDNNDIKKNHMNNMECMKKIRKNYNNSFIPGVKPLKPPAFIAVKLSNFAIPDRIWSAILGDSQQTIFCDEYDNILERIEAHLPCLSQNLNINNYTDKWHTLLYMEEIQDNINIRIYDMTKVFLIKCQEFLGIEIKGLAEKRPSLMKGDRVLVKDIWKKEIPVYEGYIHNIKGDIVLMKFNPAFHEYYSGSDVSVEFHFNRSVYRRCHQAVNLAISNLGPEILFPCQLKMRCPQVSNEMLKKIQWFNPNLNTGQKDSIHNILLGVCRPLPYCIYGPPGTGKTITVVEAILQILTFLPDSRILVASPSNSASNLITERLLGYKSFLSDSILRLIANHLLDSDSIPDEIKPYCATLDIAKEETIKSRKTITKDGINLNCPKSYVGRHRVTIGTCVCLGSLAYLGFPKGHFTHIIIDEAGQATEPELMIPLTFIDKESGQIILAGDPRQLGPVVMSKYCQEYGMSESYLSRILETFPYQQDFDAFKNGFDKRLVTKLTDNYRSLEEVLKLPSALFYDSSLVAKINKDEKWIKNMINNVIYDICDTAEGGIFVYGIKGVNVRADDSPSWFNPQEASMIALMTCKLYKKNVDADEIGIITPYIAQVKYLRLVFDAMGLLQPKIGTVEEFQGQERPFILISTVRSAECYIESDVKYFLGFLKNPKRLNVALTRAQVAAFVFCNPHLLSYDPLWQKVIKHAVKDGKYMGCDVPNFIDSENKEHL